MAGERRELRFRERSQGQVAFDRLDQMTDPDPDGTGWTPLALRLHMRVDDAVGFWDGDTHRGRCSGEVRCPGLGGRLELHDGRFDLLVPPSTAAATTGVDPSHLHMRYVLTFADRLDRAFTLVAYKEVRTGGTNPWQDTTVFLTRLVHGWGDPGDGPSPDVVATGVLRLRLVDFLVQLTTFRPGPDDDLLGGIEALTTFGPVFMWRLARLYLTGWRSWSAARR